MKPDPFEKQTTDADDDQIEFPLWIYIALTNIRRENFAPGNVPLLRLARILGSLEWEPDYALAGIDIIPSFRGVIVRIRIHPRELEIAVPWIGQHRVFQREDGRVVRDSLIRDPSPDQMREMLEWVDTGFAERGEG